MTKWTPPAIPQPDASLLISHPNDLTRFDFGNTRLYAAVNGRGELLRVHPNHCISLIKHWRVQQDGTPILFDTARGIGRSWELQNAGARLETFADSDSSCVFQMWHAAAPSRIELEIEFDLGKTAGMSVEARGAITARGQVAASFASSESPLEMHVDRSTVRAIYRIENSLTWCLADGDAAKQLIAHADLARADAAKWSAWLSDQTRGLQALPASMVTACLACSHASYKKIEAGFNGFFAGPGYTGFPRVYFRDGYWTAQVVMRSNPRAVRDHLLALSRGVQRDGKCPSGVFAPSWKGGEDPDTLAWLPDHLDSPAFYVMLAHDYVHATGDAAVLGETIQGWTLWERVAACLDRLTSSAPDGLLQKDHRANDWADNVIRSAHVIYDQALYYRALVCGAALARERNEATLADTWSAQARLAQDAANKFLWSESRGYYVDYARKGFTEDHLTADSLLTLFYGLADETQAQKILRAAKRLLQSRHNADQQWGDWGVMCVYPLYKRGEDLFEKSADPFRYHNGSDWPYLDAIYALVLKQRNDPDWFYVAARWWEYSLAQGWLTPVEYFSPAHPVGGFLQAWSGLPALVLLD
jgi:hypothetical protein